ncbi:MAG: DNA methyltransferase, partial [Candidatus Hodarchaeota archaeon]
FELVYIDPPYISEQGIGVDYYQFYHFLEGLTMYSSWEDQIDFQSKHRRLKTIKSVWTEPKKIREAFKKLLDQFPESILVVSYRDPGIPPKDEIITFLEDCRSKVLTFSKKHKYVLSAKKKRGKTQELLFIGL